MNTTPNLDHDDPKIDSQSDFTHPNGQLGIYTALAAFQSEIEPIEKNTKGYNYSYASLPEIMKTIKPALTKHNLGITQTFDSFQGTTSLVTILFHTLTGETITSEIKIPIMQEAKQNVYQALGSGITYLRRYSISAILGLVTDEDTDASDIQIAPIKNTNPVSDDPFA